MSGFRRWTAAWLALLLCLHLIALAGCGASSSNAATPQGPTSPPAGAALVEQAVSLLLDEYVDPLSSATLYRAAHEGAAAAAGGAAGSPGTAPPEFTGDRQRDAERFREAYLALARSAPPGTDQTALAYRAIRSVVDTVEECHTAFLTPEQYRLVTAQLAGQAHYAGIGVNIRPGTQPVVIGEVFPDTPAAASGLRPGDAIIEVDGTDVAELPADQIAPLVRGPVESEVTLTIRRPGEQGTRRVAVARAEIALPILTSRLVDGHGGGQIGYIRLWSFSTGAAGQLQAALAEFARHGVDGWVLDLRGNGGGYIDTLSKIASRFIEDGKPVAYVTSRDGQRDPIPTEPQLHFIPQRPLAVLIDEGSASSSEAFAAAVEDYGDGRLFGQTTAGCLAGASTYPLADGSALQVTIWEVVSPEGRQINQVGQPPDVQVAATPPGGDDPVLGAALRWLADQREQR